VTSAFGIATTASGEPEGQQRVESTGHQEVGKQTSWQATLQRHLPLDSQP
jgi:hypothetical protein